MENDYHLIEHKLKVNEILEVYNFKVVKSVRGGWGPCSDFFFEVWSK